MEIVSVRDAVVLDFFRVVLGMGAVAGREVLEGSLSDVFGREEVLELGRVRPVAVEVLGRMEEERVVRFGEPERLWEGRGG